MIKTLKVQNFALVNNIEINFQEGFNVLFGETGAGKSIILKSIYYLLGAKFNKSDVRSGEKFVKVSAVFDISKTTQDVLARFGINACDEILISRATELPSKNECRINGEMVTLEMLSEVASTLLDFYGQHENMALLKASNHISMLDDFASSELAKAKKEVSTLYAEYHAVISELSKFGGSAENRERLLDLLNYQIKEIESANIQPNEDEEIETKLYAYRNSEKVNNILESSFKKLDDNMGVLPYLKDTTKLLGGLVQFDADADGFIQRLDSCFFEIQDIADQLKLKLDANRFSERELEDLDQRLDKIKSIKKKYGKTLPEVFEFLDSACNQRDELLGAEEKIQELTKKLEGIEVNLKQKSSILTELRKKYAEQFEKKINSELSELGMKNANLKVDFNQSSTFSANGVDVVEFLFSANLGQGLKPLSKTISGGEMSRLMLVVKLITADKDAVGTLIFDEVDSGISGEIGSAMAKKIAKISSRYQVICITHLPQVCAMADAFFYVSKNAVNGKTESKIEQITSPRIEESIAKLSGGKFDTQTSIAHAKELLTWARDFKKSI
ncbi:MAG: DNA repair protein RecN [Clostridia bacterium]|nr:DNA repair protein RecN [Clostridia bacterium]